MSNVWTPTRHASPQISEKNKIKFKKKNQVLHTIFITMARYKCHFYFTYSVHVYDSNIPKPTYNCSYLSELDHTVLFLFFS